MSWLRRKTKTNTKSVKPGCRLSLFAEKLSLKTHLAYCEFKLRLATCATQKPRLQVLDRLHHYWRLGRFPSNTFKPNQRWPVFIDNQGVYCAVGYLMSQTGATQLAARLNQANRFVILEEVQSAEVDHWLATHQLKAQEAALIQPGYSYSPSVVHTGYNGGDILVVLASILLNLGLLMPLFMLVYLQRKTFEPRSFQGLKLFWVTFLTAVCLLLLSSDLPRRLVPPPYSTWLNYLLLASFVYLVIVCYKMSKKIARSDKGYLWRLWLSFAFLPITIAILLVAASSLVVNLSLIAAVSLLCLARKNLPTLWRSSQTKKRLAVLVISCGLLLTFVFPSIRYSLVQLTTAKGTDICGNNSWNDGSYLFDRAICSEMSSPRPPRLFSPSIDTFRRSFIDPDTYRYDDGPLYPQ